MRMDGTTLRQGTSQSRLTRSRSKVMASDLFGEDTLLRHRDDLKVALQHAHIPRDAGHPLTLNHTVTCPRIGNVYRINSEDLKKTRGGGCQNPALQWTEGKFFLGSFFSLDTQPFPSITQHKERRKDLTVLTSSQVAANPQACEDFPPV